MDNIIKCIYKEYGVSSEEEFKDVYKLSLAVKSLRGTTLLIISYIDEMYKSCTRLSELNLLNDTSISSAETRKSKTKIARKIRQISLLESIKQQGINRVREVVSDAFGINPDLIEYDDIIFMGYCKLTVAGHVFNYECNLTDRSFTLYTVRSQSYANAAKMTDDVRAYFKKKAIEKIA